MEINNLLESLNNNKPLLAFLYIGLSIIAAFILDKIFISFLRIIVKRTKSELDDRIIEAIHRPL